MLEELQQLRRELDETIGVLERLAPVVAAWRAAGAPRSVAKPSMPAEAAAAAGEPPGRQQPGNGVAPTICAAADCTGPVDRSGRAGARKKFCSTRCRVRVGGARAKARVAAAAPEDDLEPLPDLIERPPREVRALDSVGSDPASLRPPALPWDAR